MAVKFYRCQLFRSVCPARSCCRRGIPVIQPLKQSLSVNRIHAVTGIVNGTTNYILTAMQTEGDFADVLAVAQQLGYAEADPSADVDGLDAADKIAILASLAFGGRIKLQDVYCEGIRGVVGQIPMPSWVLC